MNDLANVDSYSDANRNSYVVHSKKIVGYKYCYNLFLDIQLRVNFTFKAQNILYLGL